MNKASVVVSHDLDQGPNAVSLRVLPHLGGAFHADSDITVDGQVGLIDVLNRLGIADTAARALSVRAANGEGFQIESTLEAWQRLQAWLVENEH